MFYPDERVVIAIDGANLYATSKSLAIDIDFRLLLLEFSRKAFVLRAYYYTAVIEGEEYGGFRPLIEWLDYNGYSVVTKRAREFSVIGGHRRVKASISVELAVDAMGLMPHFDHFVLFSGDGEFTSLVAALQRAGKRVTVASTLETPRPMIADELRRQADCFLEIASFATTAARKTTST